MTPKDLTAIGEYLYGRWWQNQLCEETGIAVGTLRAFLSGYRNLPDKGKQSVYDLIGKKIGKMMIHVLPAFTINNMALAPNDNMEWGREVDSFIKSSIASYMRSYGYNVTLIN